MQLGEFVGTYADMRPIRSSTVEQYRYCVQSFSRFLGREACLADLEPRIVSAWVRHIEATGSIYTARSRRCTLLSIWKMAADLDLVAPPRLVRPVRIPDRLPNTLSSQQVDAVIAATDTLRGLYNGYRWCDLVRTWIIATIETALRPGDMRSLEYSDVVAAGGRLTIVQRKTGRARRAVFPPDLMADFARWHSPDGLVWPLGCRNVMQRRIARVGRQAGIASLTHTVLRKTAITDVERQRPGTGWIFAGHTSPATTRDWYIDRDVAYRDTPSPAIRRH